MTRLEHIQNKIVDAEFFTKNEEELHRQKIVFTNGCFDILHVGHITYLAKARQLGDLLVVGLNSDASVRRLKGPDRPVNAQDARALVLAALEMVDYIVFFEEDTPYNIITKVKPDILVKGGDYQIDNIVGGDFVRARGGQVLTIPFVEGFSTSSILENLKQ
jgi:D-beta-D-heptose 7-phosphate kinase/D-beta-D-heptose 1-phosphate adenosyltransferase